MNNYKVAVPLKKWGKCSYYVDMESDVFHMKVNVSSKIYNFPENGKVFFFCQKVFQKLLVKSDICCYGKLFVYMLQEAA